MTAHKVHVHDLHGAGRNISYAMSNLGLGAVRSLGSVVH